MQIFALRCMRVLACHLVSQPAAGCAFTLFRNSSSSSATSSLHLVAELRKRTTVTIQKAREALVVSGGDIPSALEWLENDRAARGQRKAEKVNGRFAREGLIGVSVLGRGTGDLDDLSVRAAMVEVNCETDFVGRNELFRTLAQDVAFTAAFITDPQTAKHATGPFLRTIELSHLRDARLIVRGQDKNNSSGTVSEAVRDAITAVGENVNIRRAVAFVHNPVPPTSGLGLRVSHYVHGSLTPPINRTSSSVSEAQGKIGALVAIGLRTSPASRLSELLQRIEFNTEMNTLERAIARQIVGLKPDHIRGKSETALYNQAFDMLTTSGGQSVERILSRWAETQGMVEGISQESEDLAGLGVVDFLRWEVGEGL